MELLFFFFIFIIFVMIAGNIFAGIIREYKNDQLPIEMMEATVVGKTIRRSVNDFNYYYITFELASKERLEFEVKSKDYGMFVEGDRGKLTYQGTRFHSFERNIK